MTKVRTEGEQIVIRTKAEERARDKEIFQLGFGAGVSKATKDMVNLPPSQQMNYRKNRRNVKPSEETLDDMLDYFEKKHT